VDDPSRYWSRRHFLLRAAAAGATLVLGSSRAVADGGVPTIPDLGMELEVSVELVAPTAGTYRRPYVVVWIEDAQGLPVRTLALWIDRGAPQFIHDLYRWIRGEMFRRRTHGGELVMAVSSPTRRPGRYLLVWDGLDDRGEAAPIGEYYVCAESVRQQGPYELLRQPFVLADEPLHGTFEVGKELARVEVQYRARR
jgi:hypothetical protein